MIRPITHFVGFPDAHGAQYTNAVRVFGPPAFLHRFWDSRAQRDIADVDTVIFAEGDEHQPLRKWNGDDQFYDPDPPEPETKKAARPKPGGVARAKGGDPTKRAI